MGVLKKASAFRTARTSLAMPSCCPCNTSGNSLCCRGCVCAKAKRACSTCAPGSGDRGRCQNRRLKLSAVDVPSQPASLPFTFSSVMSSACETSKELRFYLWYSARQEEWVVPQLSHSSDCQRCLPRKLA